LSSRLCLHPHCWVHCVGATLNKPRNLRRVGDLEVFWS
jgi:hypothetical protein